MTATASLPDNLAPATSECVAMDLAILGELPRALNGTLADGRASFRNAWVRTAKWEAERRAGRLLALDEGHLPIQAGFHGNFVAGAA